MKLAVIAAALLALTIPADARRAEWFLTLDTWFCSTRSCAIEGKPHASYVEKETFTTRTQCLAEGRRLAKLPGRLIDMHDLGMTISTVIPRCERA